jgi:uncharacterized protein (TIGR03905 family)
MKGTTMHYDCPTKGVCARRIHFDLEDGKIHNVSFDGGCDGNLKAISTLLEGQPVETVALLRGNTCGRKPTSCADQLAQAVEAALASDSE